MKKVPLKKNQKNTAKRSPFSITIRYSTKLCRNTDAYWNQSH